MGLSFFFSFLTLVGKLLSTSGVVVLRITLNVQNSCKPTTLCTNCYCTGNGK